MKHPQLLNIVSGKGGTGKSLLCAVLGRLLAQEGARILLVDFDVFVRGLTHFHYRYIKERRKITEAMSVADFFELSQKTGDSKELAKERFFEVDLVPAVSEIEEQLDYLAIAADTMKKCKTFLKVLGKEKEYNFIIIDNRSGVDEIIIETSHEADVTISVSESDPISRTTNENLLRHLKEKQVGKVYTIINKVKFLRSFEDYSAAVERISDDFNVLGQIPFDLDLFETFGTSRFWDKANSTRYAFALADSWNKMAKREQFDTTISLDRFPRTELWAVSRKAPSFIGKMDRLSLLFGICLTAAYFLFDIIKMGGFEIKDMLLLYAVALFAFPVIRRLFFKRDDE